MEQVISVSPVVLPAPGRGLDLQVRISAPVKGSQLPVILFAHGYGNSLDGYAPLVNYWAARGFVVVQPSFLDSKRIGLSPDDPRTPEIWKIRVADMKLVLDHLQDIINIVPGLPERVDTSRIAAVGHSFGAQTTGMLLGMRVIGEDLDLSDARIQVGILLTAGGNGGKDLSEFAAAHYPFMNPDFSGMKKPVLVVAGDKDISPLTVRGWDWFTDPYTMSPGPKSLLTLYGGEHLLGGISGYLVTETTDENPERVAAVQQLTWAYLRSAFYPADSAWQDAAKDLTQGKIENKGGL
jgi:fermentation-respiration switch protein FrsA (DUF1100 family)